jgi:hypothetical protein
MDEIVIRKMMYLFLAAVWQTYSGKSKWIEATLET